MLSTDKFYLRIKSINHGDFSYNVISLNHCIIHFYQIKVFLEFKILFPFQLILCNKRNKFELHCKKNSPFTFYKDVPETHILMLLNKVSVEFGEIQSLAGWLSRLAIQITNIQ